MHTVEISLGHRGTCKMMLGAAVKRKKMRNKQVEGGFVSLDYACQNGLEAQRERNMKENHKDTPLQG